MGLIFFKFYVGSFVFMSHYVLYVRWNRNAYRHLVRESKGGRLLGNRGRSWERSIDKVKGKGKVRPRRCHEGPEGE